MCLQWGSGSYEQWCGRPGILTSCKHPLLPICLHSLAVPRYLVYVFTDLVRQWEVLSECPVSLELPWDPHLGMCLSWLCVCHGFVSVTAGLWISPSFLITIFLSALCVLFLTWSASPSHQNKCLFNYNRLGLDGEDSTQGDRHSWPRGRADVVLRNVV